MSRFLTTNRNIELLEPYEGKLSCTVLRGEGGSNALDLPDIEKQGDFFVESPIILLAAIIWYLKIYKNGIYCTFPHAVELLNKPYSDLFTILTSYPELENYLSPFMDAWKGNAQDQLQGQIASAKIPLTRMISPQLYWVMTGNDFHWISTIRKSPNCSAWATIRTGRTFIRQRSDYIIPVSSSLSTRKTA